jgi:osmotically-inducible protein OsmY
LPTVSTKLETRLNKMTVLKGSNVNLSVNPEGELVLKGKVASAEQAKLAENMARLEPGVRSVRNELTFPEAPSAQ